MAFHTKNPPAWRAGRARNSISLAAIASENSPQTPDPNRAFVEHVAARPGEGAVGAFAFGRSRGIIEGVLGAAGIPVTFVTPAAWKRAVGIPGASNDASRSDAIRRWPAHAALFARKKDDGRAESALIGIAGLRRAA